MKKMLLASAAMISWTPGLALAQAPTATQPSQGTLVLPYKTGPHANNVENATGSPSTFSGRATYGKDATPAPGTVVIRLNGRVEAVMIGTWSTNDSVPGFKTNPVGLESYMRLYPGIDGMATNGLRYGASIELRENFPGSAAQPTPALTTAPSASTYLSGQTVFVRRSFVYLGGDKAGILRIGAADGVIGLFDPGEFSGAGYDGGMGGLNGAGALGQGTNGAFAVPYVLAQAGAEYGNTKIVYLTPQFFGFDFGVQYAPSLGNGFSSCSVAGPSCNNQTTGTDPTRFYNQVVVGARYMHRFGPLDLGAYAVYETAAKESFSGVPVYSGFGVTGNRYDDLSFVNTAAYVTFNSSAGAFSVSADYIGGAANGQLNMKPTGGVDKNQFLIGLQYRKGPLVIGAQWNTIDTQGSVKLTHVSQRHETAVAVGGAYTVAPGLAIWVEYQYAYRHQGGVDFVQGTPATRDGRGQAVMIGTAVSW